NLNANTYTTRMLMLPSGQVLFSNATSQLYAYNPVGSPDPSWLPTINSVVSNGGSTFTISGTLLNGISEGASYGDDAEMSSNYPIIRLTDGSGHVYFARSFNFSSMSVPTASTVETAQFKLPAGLPAVQYTLQVVANGIASAGVPFFASGMT